MTQKVLCIKNCNYDRYGINFTFLKDKIYELDPNEDFHQLNNMIGIYVLFGIKVKVEYCSGIRFYLKPTSTLTSGFLFYDHFELLTIPKERKIKLQKICSK